MARGTVLLTLALALPACFSVEHPAAYTCSSALPKCPEGYECRGAKCVLKGSVKDQGIKDLPAGDFDGPRSDAPRSEGPRPDLPRSEGPKPDLPRSEGPKPDLPPKPDGTGATCGDGVKNGAEQCDKSDLGGKSCATQGFFGALKCSGACTFDTSGCHNCGNGSVDAGEDCDGTLLGGKDCKTQGFDSGSLKCSSSCKLDTSACTYASCGDGVKNGNEQCDKSDLASQTCATQGFVGGTLSCGANCAFITASCFKCGDGVKNGAEACDGSDLGGKSCATEGFNSGGVLGCTGSCAFNTTACLKCGDGVKNGTEQCEGSDLAGQTCKTLGFTDGVLACKGDCTFSTTGCYKCGDGAINPGEQCDPGPPPNLNGKTCADLGLGFTGGTPTCNASCTFNTTSCWKCGDGVINTGEECDGTTFGTKTCTALGFAATSTNTCTSGCTFSIAGCMTAGFVQIGGGTFTMGSPTTELCRGATGSIETQHSVILTRKFELAETEVTQAQFQAAMNYNPSGFPTCGTAGNCPVETVKWDEAAAYCNKLSSDRGLAPCYSCVGSGASVVCGEATAYSQGSIYLCPGYRLPTEAEWEYAYRATTATALYNNLVITSCGADTNAGLIAWDQANSGGATHPGKLKWANIWNLYDMAGNVFEWVHDWDTAGGLGSAAVTDPWGIAAGTNRLMRGGAYNYGADVARAAHRYSVGAGIKGNNLGFRVARTR